jgi:hypothetical protein
MAAQRSPKAFVKVRVLGGMPKNKCLGGGMVYTLVLEASAARIESSSLSLGTTETRFC